MSNNNITIDTSGLDKIARGLRDFEREVPGAVASALNRTIDYAYTRIGRIVSEEFVIKVTDVKKTVKKNKASKGDLEGSLISKGDTLSFAHFKFIPRGPGINKKVKVRIRKNEGLKEAHTTNKPFIANINGITNVYTRRSRDNKMVSLRSLSVPQMIQSDGVEEKLTRDINKKLNERIQHEINYRLNKLGSR